MAVLKLDNPGLAAMLLMAVVAWQGGRVMQAMYRLMAARGSRYIDLTNFGLIDDARCDFGVPLTHVYAVGPIQDAPGILIALTTYRDTMHLVVQGSDTRRFQPVIRDLLKSILAELAQAG